MVVQLNILTELLTPGDLRLTDGTPAYDALTAPGGWGGVNPARSSVNKFTLCFALSSGSQYTFETDGTTDGPLAQGVYHVSASTLGTSVVGYWGGCTPGRDFRSGCLTLTAQALSQQSVTRYRSNYTVQLAYALAPGSQLWVQKEGVWLNVTGEGLPTSTGFRWQVLNVLDSYSLWQVRAGTVVQDSGAVLTEQLTTVGVALVLTTVVGQQVKTFFISSHERQQWVNRTTDWIQSLLNQGTTGHSCPPYGALPAYQQPDDCAEGRLAYIGQLLDVLDGTLSANQTGIALTCQTGGIILKRIQAELHQWTR